MTTVPDAWYNVLPDLGAELPRDLPSPRSRGGGLGSQVPLALMRQEVTSRSQVPVPDEVLGRYRAWRPTPLSRARDFERALGTRSRIYYKYEGGNLSGSHKLNTAIAQAFYYRAAGAVCLTVGTGAGQWGTAVAAACAMFGLKCRVYMVRSSYLAKPYRRTMMEMLGAEVIPSPSLRTDAGASVLREDPESGGSLSLAMAEALEDTDELGTHFCTGSGETYSLLHQTVVGLEAREQMDEIGDPPDVVVASLGGGSNFGGLTLPFLGAGLRGGRSPRCVSVEPAACPKLTRGRYAYDYTDAVGLGPLQKMYTLGHTFAPPGIHAGGLRYHGTAKLVSLLYDQKAVEAVAYPQRAVFGSALAFSRSEGLVPAPESAHAIHGAAQEALRADEEGRSRSVLVGVSGHGLFDMAAYQTYLDGSMADSTATEQQIADALSRLPEQPRERVSERPSEQLSGDR
ncbi:TrpB-like pyridoxal phosphate-dependent enzyme [Streptomyces sp. NPDC059568]|uniref:TrpB-like pyridoxal phosphate-dependent enzyme n=1 Tax=Streptomyces sp. NPDC059568 TaxID=3346868 RepID=UPI0036AB15BD